MFVSYKLSTIGGMSRSPIILDGKVVDISELLFVLCLGVHVGCGKEANNRCVSLMAEDVWRYLKANDVSGK